LRERKYSDRQQNADEKGSANFHSFVLSREMRD
jgi:hypothetical protein